MTRKQSLGLQPEYENTLFSEGYDVIVGIDEVGRGPWAGPMYLCAYVFSPDSVVVEGVKDSKQISQPKRKALYSELYEHTYSILPVEVSTIDKNGLGNAIDSALRKLIQNVNATYSQNNTLFLVDGYFRGDWPNNVRQIKKGDSTIYAIAAASILAKVSRDEIMLNLHNAYPQYGFDSHVGYGTKKHKEALDKYGIIEGIHRKSFKPIQKYL